MDSMVSGVSGKTMFNASSNVLRIFIVQRPTGPAKESSQSIRFSTKVTPRKDFLCSAKVAERHSTDWIFKWRMIGQTDEKGVLSFEDSVRQVNGIILVLFHFGAKS